jgi:hypothetical protein
MTDDDVIVDTPVIADGELVVECEHDGCGRRKRVGTEVDAVEADPDDGDWKIRVVPADDGRLEIDGVECHEHRTDKAIDRIAREQSKTIRSIHQRSQEVMNQVES